VLGCSASRTFLFDFSHVKLHFAHLRALRIAKKQRLKLPEQQLGKCDRLVGFAIRVPRVQGFATACKAYKHVMSNGDYNKVNDISSENASEGHGGRGILIS
jgi:hypothetical protein